ncbi:MAG TPA: acyl carrier protein [Pseudolabrys sp.]|nr:acyl carrier protein [Pseudolabrys sp.]
MDTKRTVLNFFSRHGRKPLPDAETDALACSYLDMGIIDSLGIVTMISEFENDLSIHFSAEDLQSYEFQTVGGLITLIDRLRAAKI